MKWITVNGYTVDINSYYKAEILQRNPHSSKYKVKLSHKYLIGVSDTFGCFDYEDAQKWIEENLKNAKVRYMF